MSGSVSGRKVAALSFFAFASLSPAFAADPDLVITPNRTETPIARAGSAVTIITGEEIEKSRAQSLVDVLRSVPGLDIYQSGGLGTQAILSLRGSRDGQTLLMVDGIRIGDPSSTSGSIDASVLALHNVERIEVLRGPQSALYGSDAMGGVINVITKKGQGDAKTSVSVEGGSYGTLRSTGSVSGSSGKTSYALSIDALTSESFAPFGYRINRSIAPFGSFTINNVPRHAPMRKGGVSGTIGYEIDPTTRLDVGFRADGDWLRISNPYASTPAGVYSHYNKSDATFAHGYARLTNDMLDGQLRNKMTVFSNMTDRTTRVTEMCYDSSYATYDCALGYRGTRMGADYQGDLKLNAFGLLSFGLHRETETIHTSQDPVTDTFNALSKSQSTNGVFFQHQISFFEKLHMSFGGRADAIEGGETFPTWRVTAAYQLTDETKLRASAGTGARTPSLFQRFSSYGNSSLLPEKNQGFEVGIDHKLSRDASVSATLFHTSYENLVEFRSNCTTNCYYNIAKAETKGLELSAQSLLIEDQLKGRIGYTFMEAEQKNPSIALLHRPRNKATLTLTYFGVPRLDIDARVTLMGHVLDRDFYTTGSPYVTLKSYAKFDAIANYKIDQNKSAFLRAENLTNVRYEELYNYGTAGRSFYAGLRVNW
jgi:vitamin B12 transporter